MITDLTARLRAGDPSDEPAVARVRAALADRADRAGMLHVVYRTLDSPVGRLLLAATPAGLVRLAFEDAGEQQVLQDLADRVSPRLISANGQLDEAAREVDEYFAGRRTTFEIPLDLRLAHGFRRGVLDELRRVPYGRTVSYGELAGRIGSRAVRAVGTACGRNPVPIVVPCHRVIRGDGAVGNYVGGPAAKLVLLRLERAGA